MLKSGKAGLGVCHHVGKDGELGAQERYHFVTKG